MPHRSLARIDAPRPDGSEPIPLRSSGCSDEAARLARMRASVEGVFTGAADAMIEGQEALSRLMRALSAYRGSLQTLSDGALSSAVSRFVARATEAAEQTGHEAEAVGRMADALACAAPHLDDLARVVRMIECYASTARIVESDSALRGGTAFSGQIRILATRSRESYIQLLGKQQALTRQTGDILGEQGAFTEGELDRLQGLGARLAAEAEALGHDVQHGARQLRREEALVGQVSARLTQGVAALQVGDSFRQRLEHVETFLGPDLPGVDHAAARALVLRLSAAQLEGAGNLLAGELRRLCPDLEALARDTSQVMALGQELSDPNCGGLAQRFVRLGEDCRQGLGQLQEGARIRRMLEDRIAVLIATVSEMECAIGELTEIQTQMRLASVNVLLRSMHSGDAGAAMQVVARQFGELTDQCAAHQTAIVTALRGIKEIADGMRGTWGRDLSADLETIGADLGGIEDVLLSADALRGELESLLDHGPRACAEFTRCAEAMRAEHRTVEALAGIAGALAPGPLAPDAEALALAAQLRARYSMAEERAIHDRLCGEGGVEADAGPVAEEAGEGAEFEWF